MNKKLRLLLVEDETIVAMLLKNELQKIGYEVIKFVATGEDAIAFAEKEKPDLILMDINLAGKMDGIEAALAINAKGMVPIIFLTGYEDALMRERAIRMAPVSYLTKPVFLPALKSIIDAHFGFSPA